ncbi:MAG: hypothetical protein ACRD3Q_20775 [Terriglobales bacterium]
MALPAHLAEYDDLLDMLVEAFMREVEQTQGTEVPASFAPAAAISGDEAGHPVS